ncbi:MAG: Hpt domain-containing protein, partial [Isosphaeraceae bacterium]
MSDDLSGFSLMDLFRSEAEGHTALLSSGLLGLESGGEVDASTLEAMMRSAHSLKGAARIVDLHPAVKVAHALEDCFVAAQEGKVAIGPAEVDTLLRAVDLLSELTLLAEGTAIHWEIDNQDRLDAIVAGVVAVTKGGPPPSPRVVAPADEPTPAPPEPPPLPAPAPAPPVPLAEEPPANRPAEPRKTAPDEPRSAPAPRESGNVADSSDRVVRVTAESLTRLMSLAGESLVQSHQLRPIVDA